MNSGANLPAILIQIATMGVQFLPHIVACLTGLVLVRGVAVDDPLRRRATIGLVLIALAIVVQLGGSILQVLLVQVVPMDGGMDALKVQLAMLSGAGFLGSCASAAGLVMIVMALCDALRARRAAASTSVLPTPPIP